MEKLDVAGRINHPLKLAALLCGRARGRLRDLGRPDLADVLRSVRFTGSVFLCTTADPVANAELAFYAEELSGALTQALRESGGYARDALVPLRYA